MQYSRAGTLADAILPRVESDARGLALARDLALIVGFAGFVALFAQIQVRLPWTVVPITGQTFAVLVAGGALGAWRGAGAMIIYMVVGMFLLPVFTPAGATTEGTWDLHFILPWSGSEALIWDLASGGYIVGFIMAAALVGYLAEHRWDRGQWVHLAMLLGSVVLYVPGLLWLAYDLDVSLGRSLELGLYPFIVGDLMKLLLAAMVLPSAWLLVDKMGRRRR